VLEIDNYSDEALYLLAKCYLKNQDYNSAVKILRKAISIENGIEEYFDALGRAYHKLNDVDRASYYYNRAAEQGLEVSKYWENYIIFLMEQEKYDEAEKIIKRADRYTFSYRLQYLNASCQILLGNDKYGMELLKDALLEEFAEHINNQN
jgi:Tfp pilus assembly protein PilF